MLRNKKCEMQKVSLNEKRGAYRFGIWPVFQVRHLKSYVNWLE